MEECVDRHRSASTAKVNRSVTPEQKSGKEGNHTSLYGPDLVYKFHLICFYGKLKFQRGNQMQDKSMGTGKTLCP